MVVYRDKESAQLREFLEAGLRATRPCPRLAVISGAAGMGKTELLYALTDFAAANQVTVVSAVAAPTEQSLPYAVLEQLERGMSPEAEQGWTARDREGTMEPSAPASQVPLRVLRELTRRFGGPAAAEHVLIAVDDIQFADVQSLQALRYLLRHSGLTTLSVVVTEGPAPTGPAFPADALLEHDQLLRVRLVPFGVEGVGRVLSDRLSSADAARLAPDFHHATGGNPLLVRALAADQFGPSAARRGGGAPQAGDLFRQAALHCVQRSGHNALAVARGLALLQEPPTSPNVGLLLSVEAHTVRPAAAALEEAGILQDQQFRHEAMEKAVLADLPAEEAGRLRYGAARLLHQRGASSVRVATHLLAQDLRGQAEEAWVCRVLQDASHQALAAAEPDFAMRCLQMAERCCRDEPTRLSIRAQLAELNWRHQPATAVQQVQSLALPACDGQLPLRYTLRLVPQLMWYGYVDEAVAAFRVVSATVADSHAPRLDDEINATRLQMAATCPGALTASDERPHDEQRSEPKYTTMSASINAAVASAPMKAFDALNSVLGLRAGASAVSDAEQTLRSTALTEATIETLMAALFTLVLSDLLSSSARWCDRLLVQARGGRIPALLTALRALISLRQGKLTDAVEQAEASLERLPAHGWGVGIGLPLSVLVEARTHMGHHAAAAELLDRPVPESMFRTRYGLSYLHARGGVHLRTGRHHAALADFLECGALMKTWGMDSPTLAPWRTGAAESWLRLKNPERAVDLLDDELSRAHPEHLRTRGAALRVLAATRPLPHRPALLEEAVRLLRDVGDSYTMALALADLGQAYKRLGGRVKGRGLVRQAEQVADIRGAYELFNASQPTTARATPSGSGTIPAGPERTIPTETRGELTEAERRVARLAALGHTNREISRKLFITVSTVEQHLTRVYRKINIRRRQDLPTSLDFDVADCA